MDNITQDTLSLRMFCGDLRLVTRDFFDLFIEQFNSIIKSQKFSVEFKIEKTGFFSRGSSKHCAPNKKIWDNIFESIQLGTLSFCCLNFPAFPSEKNPINACAQLQFDSKRNALVIIEHILDSVFKSNIKGEMEDFFALAAALVKSSDGVIKYGYCGLGQYVLTNSLTLKVGFNSIPIYSTMIPKSGSNQFLMLNIAQDLKILSDVVDGRGIKGVYSLTFFCLRFVKCLREDSIQLPWVTINEVEGFLDCSNFTDSRMESIREFVASKIDIIS